MKPFLLALLFFVTGPLRTTHAAAPPNILFLFADDWGKFASCYQDAPETGLLNQVVRTPHLDRLALTAVRFRNAHVNAPSCTPCRSALLSGQYFWRTGKGAILSGATWDPIIPSWPLLLRAAGYHIGKSHKVWGPGTPADAPYGGQQHAYQKAGARINQFSEEVTGMTAAGQPLEKAKLELLDEVRDNFRDFLTANPDGRPFCYWFGPTNVHRKWVKGSGKALWNLDPDQLKGKLPPFLPDVPEVREDLADYFGEVAAWDASVGTLLAELDRSGQRENTLIVISGDHGAPGFPHGKCNLYGFGTGVALFIAGPGVTGGRVVDDFVNLTDLAPTLLEAGRLPVPNVMTGRSLWPVLKSDRSGQVDATRDAVFTGRERHVESARADFTPYPQRAIRTASAALIINFRPDRWPMGDPYGLTPSFNPPQAELENETRLTLPDEDAGPTKAWLVRMRETPEGQAHFQMAYSKRPRYELYDLKADPHETLNLADDPAHRTLKRDLENRLLTELRQSGDPRVTEDGRPYETPPLSGPLPQRKPAAKKPAPLPAR